MTEQPRDNHGRFAPKKDDPKDLDKIESATGIPKETIEGTEAGLRTSEFSEWKIKFEEIPDEKTREAVKQMEERLNSLSEIEKSVQQLKAERDQAKKSQIMSEIEKISPHLAEKNQDKSISELEVILETAKEFKGVKSPPKLLEQDNNQSSDEPVGRAGWYDATKGEWVTN